MTFVILLALAYGPLNWSFPWWVWLLALGVGGNEVTVVHKWRK